MKYNLSVIIPCYKERDRIAQCITTTLQYLKQSLIIDNFEIILVLDDAGDGTREVINNYLNQDDRLRLIDNPKRLQKGFSVRAGMLQAKYEIMMFFDVDLSTSLSEIENFLLVIEDYDILIASRRMKGSRVVKSRFKKFISAVLAILNLIFLGLPYLDTQCGFKMFKHHTKTIFKNQSIKSGAFDIELLVLAQIHNFKIREIPVTWVDKAGSNFIWWQVIPHFLLELIKIRYRTAKKYIKLKRKYYELNR